MMNTRCGASVHRAAAAVLLLLVALIAVQATATATVNANAWLSAPASVWNAITGGSDSTTQSTVLKHNIQTDFSDAITALDSGASVAVNTLSPNTAPASGPIYGTQVAYTVSSTVLTAAQIDDCVRAATLTNLNSAIASAAPSLGLTITVLNAESPADVTQVTEGYVALSGAAFLWQMVMSLLTSAGDLAMGGFVIPLEQDLQAEVDSTGTSYLVVVPTTAASNIVNASSLYMNYAIWAYPTNTDTTTAAALQTRANSTALTNFNTFVGGLKTTYPDLADYSDLIPTKVTTWAPLYLNPAGDSDDSDAVVVQGEIAGNYILVFAGDAGTWQNVWDTKQSSVSSTIVSAATTELTRRRFVTSVKVLSASTVPNVKTDVGGLRVVCYVSQGYGVDSQHIWMPNDIASMLLQGDYSATKSLYTAAAGGGGSVKATPTRADAQVVMAAAAAASSSSTGNIATTRIDYDFSAKMLMYEIGMIIMAAVIGFLCVVAFLIACGCCCCCRRCIATNKDNAEGNPEWENDLDRYQRGMQNQDEVFMQAERPLEQRQKNKKPHASRGIAEGTQDSTASLNPLVAPAGTEKMLTSPREGDDYYKADKATRESATPPPAATSKQVDPTCSPNSYETIKKDTPPMAMAHGVPLEAAQSASQSDYKPYAQYYTRTPEKEVDPAMGYVSPTPPPPILASNGHNNHSSSDDSLNGSHSKRLQKRSVSFSDDPRAGRRAHQHAQQEQQQQHHHENPLATADAAQVAPYMANVAPTAFYSPYGGNQNASATDADAMNQTRLSQGSASRSLPNSPAVAPAAPAYPYYQSPHTHASPSPPYDGPTAGQTSPGYASLPSHTPAAYPSADLYAGAPVPQVGASMGSFTPMQSVLKK